MVYGIWKLSISECQYLDSTIARASKYQAKVRFRRGAGRKFTSPPAIEVVPHCNTMRIRRSYGVLNLQTHGQERFRELGIRGKGAPKVRQILRDV
jgi:hypothetical protein